MSIVTGLIIVILVIAVGYGLRLVLLYRVGTAPRAEDFAGVVFRVGQAAVAERSAPQPRATVVAMPGLFENPRYFTRFYSDPDIQLILLTSADYHVPFAAEPTNADWATPPPSVPGTIEYDAAVLVQALEHLPKSAAVRVHGHSRGGAVVLEAAAMRPDLFRGAEVILEAPVVPRARPRRPTSRAARWFIPFVVALWRRAPISKQNQYMFGRLDDSRKRELIGELPFNPRRLITVVRNLESLETWMAQRAPDVYQNVKRGTILIADDDQVLDSDSIRTAAQQAGQRLNVVEVQDCSHFIVLDRPEAVPPLDADRRARRPATANSAR